MLTSRLLNGSIGAIRIKEEHMRRFLIAAAAALAAAPAVAEEKIDFILNWVPGGDHAPY